MTRRTSISVRVVAVLLLAAGLSARQGLTKQDSESMLRKLNAIESRGAQPPSKDAKPLRTSFTEREVNAYFKYDVAEGKKLIDAMGWDKNKELVSYFQGRQAWYIDQSDGLFQLHPYHGTNPFQEYVLKDIKGVPLAR